VVVVIVGAVVCAIVVARVLGQRSPMTGSQPATAWRPAALAGETPAPAAPGAWTPPSFATEPDEHPPAGPQDPLDVVPRPRRIRAMALLTTWVVLIGAAAAAMIGATALIVVQIADKALGP
jgi:hypothetical protein